ncbi:hypothetical protein ASE98_08425 [Pseudomonas sp. Leaf48]|uniref:hypothetical protein n=1 Tax=Pseudomonas sp. Leaf48 TaxID=1736221 RepID=UPI00072A144E|nr:hypothetical protein [Pseudomonas sp. Leaf48]KQN45087.1 hypothetical protein ASE98_08425 [Pseudomonas sp. Leaf48]
MDNMESVISVAQSVELVRERLRKRQSRRLSASRVKNFSAVEPSSPTKELDALVLGNTLIGYGGNISLENMAIIENLIKFSKLEASFEVPDDDGGDPQAWYLAFLKCMDEVGCFVADSGYTVYHKQSHQLTMDNIVTDIVKAGVDAAKAAIPGATALNAVLDSTLGALKNEPEAINLFNSEVAKDKGVRLAIMPCDQLTNGIILTSLSSIDVNGGSDEKGVIFFDWKSSGRNIFRGTSYITFNPLRYAAVKKDLEEYLGDHFNAAMSKRIQRRKKAGK